MSHRRTTRPTPGVVLLEVLLALSLFAIAAAVVGSAMRTAMASAVDMRARTQAVNLAHTVFARLATGEVELAAVDATAVDEDDLTWTYEILLDPVEPENPALQRVTVTIRSGEGAFRPRSFSLTQWILDTAPAEAEEEFGP